MKRIPQVVITGGPGAGESSGISFLAQKLATSGYLVIPVHESATEVFLDYGTTLSARAFQKRVLERIVTKEEAARQTALALPASVRPIILCDRGIHDNAAYQERSAFERSLLVHSLCPLKDRDERYDAVIHLRTAALGAEESYTIANNAARRETLAEARALDERTLGAWLGHPKLRVIANLAGEPFEHKLERAWKALAQTLGIPTPLEIERRFLIQPGHELLPLPVAHEIVHITQTYLSERKQRIRARSMYGKTIFTRAYKRTVRKGVREEIEEAIDEHEYRKLLVKRDPERGTIIKDRVHFIWNNQHFELDIFAQPKELAILEIELSDEAEQVTLPPFLPIEREITHEKKYTNYRLSKWM